MIAARRSDRFARFAARKAGRSSTSGLAALVILGWAVTGPLFGFSDTWQLAMCTSTTIVTFVMVVLIQNTQNRDSAATQMKLDEIIRATMGAHSVLLDLEERSDDELSVLRAHYSGLLHVTDGVGKRVAHRPQNH
jgi:low affinity Fe/Cu permease